MSDELPAEPCPLVEPALVHPPHITNGCTTPALYALLGAIMGCLFVVMLIKSGTAETLLLNVPTPARAGEDTADTDPLPTARCQQRFVRCCAATDSL